MPSSEVSQTLANVLHILRCIQSGRDMTIADLARELDRSERQVRRYLHTLEEAGFQLGADEQGHFSRRIRLHHCGDQTTPLELLALTREEMILLYLQLAGIQTVGDRELQERLIDKIRNAMAGEPVDFNQLTDMLLSHERAFKTYDTPVLRGIITDLLEALYWNKTCRFTYRTPQQEDPRQFEGEPYRLMEFDGGLYCLTYLPSEEHVRLLAVERVQQLELRQDAYFERSEEVEGRIEAYLERAFRLIDDGDRLAVRLRFSPDQAPYAIERTWHPTQQVRRHEDGSATLSLEASGRFEIIRWILGWGRACRVEAPGELRDQVAEELRQALGQY